MAHGYELVTVYRKAVGGRIVSRGIRARWKTAAAVGTLLMAALVGDAPAGAVTGANGIYAAAATFSAPPESGTISEPLSALPLGLAPHGYVQDEYFAVTVGIQGAGIDVVIPLHLDRGDF